MDTYDTYTPTLIHTNGDIMCHLQYSDQLGPTHAFPLTLTWANIVSDEQTGSPCFTSTPSRNIPDHYYLQWAIHAPMWHVWGVEFLIWLTFGRKTSIVVLLLAWYKWGGKPHISDIFFGSRRNCWRENLFPLPQAAYELNAMSGGKSSFRINIESPCRWVIQPAGSAHSV